MYSFSMLLKDDRMNKELMDIFFKDVYNKLE